MSSPSFPLPDSFDADVVVYLTQWLQETTGQHTVPQIFIKGRSVGGYQELAALDADGGL